MAADFYSVLVRAIASLSSNTADARAALFASAREALVTLPPTNFSAAQLDLSSALAALDAAIERIEDEYGYAQLAFSERRLADFVSADLPPADTSSVDASQEFIEPEDERSVDTRPSQPYSLDPSHFYVTELVNKARVERNSHSDGTTQVRPSLLANDWPPLTNEHSKARSKPKAIAAAAAIVIFGALGYVGISGTLAPPVRATKSAPAAQPSPRLISKLQVHGIELRMDGQAAVLVVAKSLQAEYGPIHDRLWDWKVCSPQAEKAMSDDGVDRAGWLKKYCFAIISFGDASTADRAKLHLVEDPASYKSIVGSFQLTLGSSAHAVDSESILKAAISEYGEPHRVRSPGGRSGRCLVWSGEDQPYLEFCAESCCVAITFEDQDLIRHATLDYDRRMGIIARPPPH